MADSISNVVLISDMVSPRVAHAFGSIYIRGIYTFKRNTLTRGMTAITWSITGYINAELYTYAYMFISDAMWWCMTIITWFLLNHEFYLKKPWFIMGHKWTFIIQINPQALNCLLKYAVSQFFFLCSIQRIKLAWWMSN